MALTLSGSNTWLMVIADLSGMPVSTPFGAWPAVFSFTQSSPADPPGAGGSTLTPTSGAVPKVGYNGPVHVFTRAADFSGTALNRADVWTPDSAGASSLQPLLQRAITAIVGAAISSGLITLTVTADVNGNYQSATVGYAGWTPAAQYTRVSPASWTPSAGDQTTLTNVLKGLLTKLIAQGGL